MKENKKEKKPKKAKEYKEYSAEDTRELTKRRRKRRLFRWLRALIVLIIIGVALFIGIKKLIEHVDNDVHNVPSYYRGSIVDGNYCFYLEESDEIVVYSTSKGPRRIPNTSEEYAGYMEKLRPADTSEDNILYLGEIKTAMGEEFDPLSYKYVDSHNGYVLFIHTYDGADAIWLYTGKTGKVDMLVADPKVKPIAYFNDVLYARNESTKETLCYRVSTSFSRQLISVEPFAVITSDKVSFWYTTVMDFGKGLINGLKASRDTR